MFSELGEIVEDGGHCGLPGPGYGGDSQQGHHEEEHETDQNQGQANLSLSLFSYGGLFFSLSSSHFNKIKIYSN